MTGKAINMNSLKSLRPGRRAAFAATAALAGCVAAVMPFMASGNAGSTHKGGVVCTKSTATAGKPVFDLTAKDGHIQLPDGNTAYMWGYSTGYDHKSGEVKPGDGGAFQHPGPVLCVTAGDTVTVVLHNKLKHDDVSIVFPGQKNVKADGAPVQPQMNGSTVTSLAQTAQKSGGTVTYTFTADRPGTFLYESGTNPQIQVKMGLFGALIVRPAGHPDQVYDRGDSKFNPDSEYMVLLSEIDPYLNQRMEQIKTKLEANPPQTPPAPFNLANYHPRYWLLNGRGFPDSIADNFADWLPNQPYGALAEIKPKSGTNPDPSVDRYLSVGSQDYPFHPHGNNAKVIGRDGYPLETADVLKSDLSFDKFSIPAGPGQTWDALFDWTDQEQYNPDTNPVPTTNPQLQNLVIGTFYGGTPYLGTRGPLPPGSSTQNECGEYYIIAHNHALFQITSWGVNMTGPITYTRVNPPNTPCP